MAERINAVKTSFFGKGAIRLLGPELQKMGIRRALLVTDRFLYDSGAAARVGQVLSDAGVEYAVYYNVQPNPTVQVVNDCIAAARTLQVQLLVALGGGSAIDTSKAIAVILTNPEFADVRSLEGASPTKNKALPIIAVSTTSGTAAEVIGLCSGTIGERLYTAKVYFQTADLFAWTAVIVLLSVLFEGLFLRGVDALTERWCA